MKPELVTWTLIPLLAWATADLCIARWAPPPLIKPIPTAPAQPQNVRASVTPMTMLLSTSASGQAPKAESESHNLSVTFPLLTLRGTLCNGDGSGVAFLQSDKSLRCLSTGQASPDSQFVVTKVEKSRVFIQAGEESLSIHLGETVGAKRQTKPAQEPQLPSHRELVSLLNEPSTWKGVKATPELRNGEMIGMRLRLAPGHLLERLGLKDGDILHSVNQKALNQMGALSKLLPMLRNSHTLRFELERNETKETLVVDLN